MSESELREQFNRQAGRVQRLEDDLKALNGLVRIIDRELPVMLAYLDSEERYRYHNQAYRSWLGMSAEFINGRTMREVLGEAIYEGIAEHIRQALSGSTVRYERAHTTASGAKMRICVHLVPHFNEHRAVVGLYSLIIDHGVNGRAHDETPAAIEASRLIVPLDPADPSEDAPELYDGAVGKAQSAWREAAVRIRQAIDANEFHLYCQAIRDLAAEVSPFYEILIRQADEELNRLPPGAFFELAEEYGMLSELDRWVVCGVLGWAAACRRERPDWRPSMYCISLSRDSISDPYFPDYVHEQLSQSGFSAETLCFELLESHVAGLPADSAELVRNLRSLGTRTMLGGFGRDKVSLEILKELHFDFLKIDGSVVLNLLRSEASLAKMRGIVRLAHTVGTNTVAEMVENDETIAKLRELEVDYAQGIAISDAFPLSALMAN